MFVKNAAVVLMLLGSTSIFAVTLINKDHQNYDIKVKGSSSTMNTSISAGTVKSNICSSCTIIVEGLGEIDASGSDKVTINNGKLETD
ncbi:MAG: hypothetical protein Q8Q33_07115 [Chlamydiota bacterium]|nr:hypothetical protein [Chlamydiota bacterium]